MRNFIIDIPLVKYDPNSQWFEGDIVMTGTINLKIICANSPSKFFGLQDKNKEIIEGTQLEDGRLAFTFELPVKQTDNGQPNFTGEFAHGTVKERFIYLTTKALPNAEWRILQRSKVHLKTVTWEQVETVLANPNTYLEAEVDVSRTGSIPLLGDGWVVKGLG